MNEKTSVGASRSDLPEYVTRRGKYLWKDDGRYDFLSLTGYQILVDQNGKFWGFASDKRVIRVNSPEDIIVSK